MTATTIAINDPHAMSLALEHLQAGSPVAFPTDTVYGIGAPALNSQAVVQLYAIKQRPRTLAIPVLLADIHDVQAVVQAFPPEAEALAKRHWPGALSLVLPATPHLPSALLANGTSVAIRIPDHLWLRELIRQLQQPLAATSANLHGNPETTTATDVAAQLGANLSLIIDGGTTKEAIPSTIVDCTGEYLRVLRQGALHV